MEKGGGTPRRAARVDVSLPVVVQGQQPLTGSSSPPTPRNYEAVPVPTDMVGVRLDGTITNLSLNGAFVTVQGPVPPLLSRLELSFELEGFGRVVAHCIVMWRTLGTTGTSTYVAAPRPGVGVLFEAIALEARQAIADLVRKLSAARYQALVVEDSDVMRRLVVDSLRRLEVDDVVAVTEARHGAEALKLLESRRFDVIVSDIYMPEMDGLKLISRIRAHPLQKDVPILIITADTDPMDEQRAMDLGANAYLVKPLQKGQICEAVRALLGLA